MSCTCIASVTMAALHATCLVHLQYVSLLRDVTHALHKGKVLTFKVMFVCTVIMCLYACVQGESPDVQSNVCLDCDCVFVCVWQGVG